MKVGRRIYPAFLALWNVSCVSVVNKGIAGLHSLSIWLSWSEQFSVCRSSLVETCPGSPVALACPWIGWPHWAWDNNDDDNNISNNDNNNNHLCLEFSGQADPHIQGPELALVRGGGGWLSRWRVACSGYYRLPSKVWPLERSQTHWLSPAFSLTAQEKINNWMPSRFGR